jgi:two-component system LytT family response regulator
MIRALIVDDEPLARRRIRSLLTGKQEIDVIAEADDGLAAIAAITGQSPDLVFLDIQMPEVDGFEVIRQVGIERMPQIIFVTAYDEYAVKAFEVHAVDYLLKPFDPDRFHQALERACRQIRLRATGKIGGSLDRLLNELDTQAARRDRFVIKAGGQITMVPVLEVDWVESAGNYVTLWCGRHRHLLRETMANIETRLKPAGFARIHRTAIVNVDRIANLKPHFHGDHIVELKDGTKLMLSRRYRSALGHLLR